MSTVSTTFNILALERTLKATPRRWLITGVAGFIGSHLAAHLLKLGQEVVGLDNFSTGYRRNIDGLLADAEQAAPGSGRNFTLLTQDICDLQACMEATKDIDHVLHQAALGSVPRSIEDPLTTHQVNANGFINLLEAIRVQGHCKSLVFASSSSVYGDSEQLPKHEDNLGQALSPYASSKQSNESYAAAWNHAYNIQCRGLRYFNVVGARQDPQGAYAAVIPRWIAAFIAGETPTIFGDGLTSRDFCPIENVIQANLLAAIAPPSPDFFFNIALGGRTTLQDLFTMLRDGMDARGFDCAQQNAQYQDFRPGDIRHSHASIARAVAQLGYDPTVPLVQGLSATMDWYCLEAR